MTAVAGRTLVLKWGSPTPNTVAGVREKSVSLNGEPIDVTNDDDNGWRTLLSVSQQDEVNITVSGVTKDDVLRAAWFGTRMDNAELVWPDGAKIEGTFVLASYTETGAYQDAITFEAELRSSGEVTYTPAA